jgi:drug/metabolite transporter (DMT)-like permease
MVPDLNTTIPLAAFLGYWFIIGICPPWPPWPRPWPIPWPPPPPPWFLAVGVVGAVLGGWGFTSLLGGLDAVTTRLDFVLTGAFALAGAAALRQITAVVAGGGARGAAADPAGPANIQR